MTIEEMRARKRELGMTNEELAVRSGVPLGTVQKVLSGLPPRERLVLEMRYGLADGRQHPQHEVAKVLGISRSYVSRVEKKAVELLRQAIGEGH